MFAHIFSEGALRAACAAGFNLLLVLFAIPKLIRMARRHQFGDREGKSDSNVLNQLHEQKRSTPIVGGIAVIGGAIATSLLFADLTSPETWVLLISLLGLASLGFVDDWTKTFGVHRKRGLRPHRSIASALAGLRRRWLRSSELTMPALLDTPPALPATPMPRRDPEAIVRYGLSARQKLAGQALIGVGVALFLLGQAHWGQADVAVATTVTVPFVHYDLGLGVFGFTILALFLVTGTSNAVNLTDGLDGLAGGCGLVALGVYMGVALASADVALASRFGLEYAPGAVEVAVVLASLVGGLTGFLVFNRHPARCFMGDTGSLPLGGVLAVAALLTRQELLLAIVGGVFVIEAISVMAQVGCFKLTGKRVLRCAPLHHHFEFQGFGETQIVAGFHTAALVLGLLSLAGLGLTA